MIEINDENNKSFDLGYLGKTQSLLLDYVNEDNPIKIDVRYEPEIISNSILFNGECEQTYTILDHNEIKYTYINEMKPIIRLPRVGIINKIIVQNLSVRNKYFLFVDEINLGVLNATKNEQNTQFHTIQFDELPNNIKQYTTILKDDREPTIENREKYINFYKTKHIMIKTNANVMHDNPIQISLFGCFKQNGLWLFSEKKWHIYSFNIINAYISHNTHTIMIKTTMETDEHIYFYLCIFAKGNYISFGPFQLKSETYIKFNNSRHLFEYSGTNYLSKSQKNNNLNFSQIDECYFILSDDIGTRSLKLFQYYYNIKNKKNLKSIETHQ